MFNKQILQDILIEYKQQFSEKLWPNERYKWEAVQYFQNNWDINAEDFPGMLKLSLSKTDNLLLSRNHFPAGMIIQFASAEPESVRGMFLDLYDESKDLLERFNNFKVKAKELLSRSPAHPVNHYQDENAISTYLWLKYPNKYYIYKYTIAAYASNILEGNYSFRQGDYSTNIRNYNDFYNEVSFELQKDKQLREIVNTVLTPDCYPDPDLHILTIDLMHFINTKISKNMLIHNSKQLWFPENYTPGFSVNEWTALLQDKEIFTESSLQIMKRFLDNGGQASCSELSKKYGESHSFYSSGSVALAKRIAEKTGCPLLTEDRENSKWWPVLYVGKYADSSDPGTYIWKLRAELKEALDNMDLSDIPMYAKNKKSSDNKDIQYWFLNANPKIWSMSSMPIGEVQNYTLYNENGNKRRIYQNFLDAKAGDLVIGYESTPVKQIVAILKVTQAQDGTNIYFEKLEGLTSPIDYSVLKKSSELQKMEYFSMNQGSLFKLRKDEFDFIMDMIRDENNSPVLTQNFPYTKEDFLHDVYVSEAKYNRMATVLLKKKNIILQGAPGVGKTFAAKRLAYSIMGEKDDDRIEFIQFHQNYSYEDFMMGYKPVEDGFELKYGIFYRFCQKAANHPDQDYFFIIDEINRGNLSKIFGELLMLIEADYRDKKATLAYNGLPFSVPSRLHIIGMMNTADRSLAMIDYALRRRFSFIDMEPGFDSKGFLAYQESLNNETFDMLIDRIRQLNQEISADKSLGKGFCIGHSYFCNAKVCTDEWMKDVVDFDILPMLSEYWFDDDSNLQRWENILHGVFQ